MIATYISQILFVPQIFADLVHGYNSEHRRDRNKTKKNSYVSYKCVCL